MKKRLISMLLSAALFVTSIPMPVSADNQVNEGNASTAVSSEGNQGETQENGIDYKMNGGAFTSGYEAPDTYPAGELPTEENITKAGYEFGGWYEDENFSGERITSLDTADHSGAIVLYAKWIVIIILIFHRRYQQMAVRFLFQQKQVDFTTKIM